MSEKWGETLLEWFSRHMREFPWRGSRDPYAVWVSEVMLQQTRVDTALPYFERWMKLFPDVQALADAPLDAVLKAWEGLGYYRRAHLLHRAAQVLVSKHGGRLPHTAQELQRLPGIGAYTAAAIGAIAFGQPEIALDGNLRRVLSRLTASRLDPQSAEGEHLLRAHALAGLPSGQASDFNQALMDLGATLCLPRSPRCGECPLAESCRAEELGIQEELPLKKPRAPIPHHQVVAAVIQRDGEVLVGRRPEGELLGGLWEFPGGKVRPGESLRAGLARELQEELGVRVEVGEQIGVFQHAYTHFRVTLHAFLCSLSGGGNPRPLDHSELRWGASADLTDLPMGKLDRGIAEALQQWDTRPENQA